MNTYQIDTLVQLSNLFTLIDGSTPADPTTVILFIQPPNGPETQHTGGDLTNPSVGVYTFQVLADQAGPWIYKWQGTGTVEVTSADTYFQVQQSAVLA